MQVLLDLLAPQMFFHVNSFLPRRIRAACAGIEKRI
jgi:hypothetical protein